MVSKNYYNIQLLQQLIILALNSTKIKQLLDRINFSIFLISVHELVVNIDD